MKSLKSFILLMMIPVMMFAGAEIADFSGYAESSRIVIQWNTVFEDDVSGFEIQRSTDGINFFNIGFLSAQGSGTSYTYVDDSIIAKVSGRTYHYRLNVKNLSGSSKLSDVLTIETSISSVTHTWGSLKALFK